MFFQIMTVSLLAVSAFAAPVGKPALDASHPAAGSAEKRANFKADPMLAVGLGDMSSYATEKRGNFKADPMLAVGVGEASSYATEKRGNFKADPMLAVEVGEASSYAS